ncbi:hypothetical protein Csa_023709, partial [Cucumis sativus]
DILITGSTNEISDLAKDLLKLGFKLKELHHAKYFLGLELSRSTFGIYIFQRKLLPTNH